MQLVLDARRDQADHALVPMRLEDADADRLAAVDDRERLIAHLRFELTAIAIELIELPRDGSAVSGVAASKHSMPVRISSRRPAALMRAQHEAHVRCAQPGRASAPRLRAARRCPLAHDRQRMRASPCCTSTRCCNRGARRRPTVPSATRSRNSRDLLGAIGEPSRLAQMRAQRDEQVEHHADAGEVLRRELATTADSGDDRVGDRPARCRRDDGR